jgi:hypothetical protein
MMNWDIRSRVRQFVVGQTPSGLRTTLWILKVILAVLAACFAFTVYEVTQEFKFAKGLGELIAALTFGLPILTISMFTFNGRLLRLEKRERWLSDVTRFHFDRLKRHGLLATEGDADEAAATIAKWPWGNHHTEALGHLEAAARKWWVLYDPSDLTTAPTNEMVSEWLQTERNVSREKARAIASMLRPDGLPTGPRR